jgi:hypothetical protein
VGDVLTLDLDRDLTYVDQGFPMDRAVGQTALPALARRPPPGLDLPLEVRRLGAGETWYGAIPLGNTDDRRMDFALLEREEGWVLWVDTDDDEDLTDDEGPFRNDGSGDVLAARVTTRVRVLDDAGGLRVRPYTLWIWFDESERGEMRGWLYGLNHYRGRIEVNGASWAVTAFEKFGHDGLYHDAGVCIDLSADGSCDEATELFRDGDVVPTPEGTLRLRLPYP